VGKQTQGRVSFPAVFSFPRRTLGTRRREDNRLVPKLLLGDGVWEAPASILCSGRAMEWKADLPGGVPKGDLGNEQLGSFRAEPASRRAKSRNLAPKASRSANARPGAPGARFLVCCTHRSGKNRSLRSDDRNGKMVTRPPYWKIGKGRSSSERRPGHGNAKTRQAAAGNRAPAAALDGAREAGAGAARPAGPGHRRAHRKRAKKSLTSSDRRSIIPARKKGGNASHKLDGSGSRRAGEGFHAHSVFAVLLAAIVACGQTLCAKSRSLRSPAIRSGCSMSRTSRGDANDRVWLVGGTGCQQARPPSLPALDACAWGRKVPGSIG
jgi:hypothetical protein